LHFYIDKKGLSSEYILTIFISISTTRQTGGLLRAISPCYRSAPKGAGFHFVQTTLPLPLFLTP